MSRSGLTSLLAAALMFVIGAAPAFAEPSSAGNVQPAKVIEAVDIASLDEPLRSLTLGRVIGVVTGIAFGEVVLHGLMGLPGLPSIVAGGYAGWWVYTGYIEPQVKSGVRKIAAAADDARLYWVGTRDPG